MLIYAMLYFLGRAVNAPVWFWVCWGLSAYTKLAVWTVKFVKVCKEE